MKLNYLFDNWRRVAELTVDHLVLSATALAIAFLIALPLGVALATWTRLSLPMLGILGIIYTIPSLAFLAFLIPSLGLGRKPAIAVLVAYAQVALVRNIAIGLRGVDPAILEAAAGCGMSPLRSLVSVRIPLALPVVVAGLRIAAVTTISLATITAWIAAGGLGTLMFDGLARQNQSMIVAGAVTIAALALVVDAAFRIIEHLLPASRARTAG